MAGTLSALARRTFSTTIRKAAVSAAEGHAHDGGSKPWKMVSILVAFPAIGLCMANAFLTGEHEERPEFVEYEHLRLRTRRFPWGDGQKSLFHNSHANALPDGYEEDDH
ncbi:cytochrome c oxidase subunit 6A, mitochondrial-like [Panulirus ornatus]|uniref:cytochrome c oxidase subunit 6A, mitochondrial-like n=1 Tax=Panulirus ornatus TaxID=150431 RepID=UPI003A88A18B